MLPLTPQPPGLLALTPQQAGTSVGHYLSEELLQSLICANQTWPLDAVGWWYSSSASPEQLLCVCFQSSFISCSRHCKSSPATHVSGVLPTQLPSTSTCTGCSLMQWTSSHWQRRISSVVCLLMLYNLYICTANFVFSHTCCSSQSLKPPEKWYNPIGSHFHDTCSQAHSITACITASSHRLNY